MLTVRADLLKVASKLTSSILSPLPSPCYLTQTGVILRSRDVTDDSCLFNKPRALVCAQIYALTEK